jgi:hypothetical protein
MNLSHRRGIALRIAAFAVGLTIGTGDSAHTLARLREMTATTLLSRPGITLRGGTNDILRGAIARGLELRS